MQNFVVERYARITLLGVEQKKKETTNFELECG